ncbi:MAG: LLM class flavin-dependent oxidoreductase, partial [Deltaproteobacteria bacterium]
MDLGRVGLWHFLDVFPASIARAAAREIEHLGFKALWIPEALGREAFTHAGFLLGATERLIVATGIANVWARDAMAMAAAQKTLAEAYPGRFLLGIGVSHAPLVAGMRGHDYA